jgi:hypothetical protein
MKGSSPPYPDLGHQILYGWPLDLSFRDSRETTETDSSINEKEQKVFCTHRPTARPGVGGRSGRFCIIFGRQGTAVDTHQWGETKRIDAISAREKTGELGQKKAAIIGISDNSVTLSTILAVVKNSTADRF